MVISKIRGEFEQHDSWVETEDENFEGAQVYFSAETASVNTRVKMRDDHLKSEEFFHSEKHPKMEFRSTSFEKISDESYKLKGDLTIRDVTKPVTLDVDFGGVITDPYGLRRAGFGVTGKVNRKEFGMTYNQLIETGGAVAGDEISLDIHVEFTYQK
jgi:polyisoprenoid-binding protein YceI